MDPLFSFIVGFNNEPWGVLNSLWVAVVDFTWMVD